jgi:serine/threonine-protein kinase
MSGNDDETGETTGWHTEEIPTGEARRLVDGAPVPDGLRPLTLPDFDGDDLATEALDTASRGAELPRRYEVQESLGREDYGDLFSVYDRELDRTVVLKLLREDAPMHALSQFRDDAQTVARIDHPGAVTVFDFGALDDGRPFVTRARLDGRPLGRWAREVETRRVVRWIMWATDTLAAAQRVGIVHRRLEPDSVVVGRVVKVRGFGTGVAEPSPYMAPELVRGEPSDATADVYSLGAIALDVLGERSPPEVDAILTRATDPDPALRHPTAEALLADLEDWLDR